jgi:hypothetical protein
MLDKQELWSRSTFRSWSPHADLALLIGYPFSVLGEAGTRLGQLGIPYVPDVGDPWTLTSLRAPLTGVALARARRVEARVWRGARAAIVTTGLQAERLGPHLGDKPVLVRPNGFEREFAERDEARDPRPPLDGTLRLMHFGTLYGARVDVWPFLVRLAEEGGWQSVEFHQFGPAWGQGELDLPSNLRYFPHDPIPWSEAVDAARHYHAAVAVGSRDPAQLPSKVVSYLTLPVPRIAFVDDPVGNSITEYVEDKPGWLVAGLSEGSWPRAVADHVAREWTWDELRPPESESWDAVAAEVNAFLFSLLPEARAFQANRLS